MLVEYGLVDVVGCEIRECMVLVNNINNGITNLPVDIKNRNIFHILTFGGYIKMRESLYTPKYEFGQCHLKQHGY